MYTQSSVSNITSNLNAEHFKVIYQNSPIAIELYDSKGLLLDVNPACIELFGIEDPNEIRGFNLFNDPNLPEEKIALIKQGHSIRNELNFNFDLVKGLNLYKTRRSGRILLAALITPVKDIDGNTTHILVQLIDNTEKKKSEERLKSYSKELKELNKTKDKLFSVIAHDLRNPFQSLLSISELLHSEFNNLSESDRQNLIESLKEQSRNTYRLVEHLLEWGKIQSGKHPPSPESFNLIEEIEPQLQLLKQLSANKSITLEWDIDEPILLCLDKNMVTTVIRNLVDNSIKFTNPGGKIFVAVKRYENTAEIAVSDNGVGISHDNLKQLFKAGGVKSTRGTAGETGSALGLLLVKEMVEQNGGTITVESKPEQGTTFYFTLPLK